MDNVIIKKAKSEILPGSYSYMLFQAQRYLGLSEEAFNIHIYNPSNEAEEQELDNKNSWYEKEVIKLEIEQNIY